MRPTTSRSPDRPHQPPRSEAEAPPRRPRVRSLRWAMAREARAVAARRRALSGGGGDDDGAWITGGVGLAFSGGGVRSASFGAGVLWALAEAPES